MNSRVRHPELAWWVVGIALFAVLVWAAYLNLGIILLSLFIYYATRPLLQRVEQFVPSRSIAVMVSLTLFVLPALVIIGYTVNIAIHELYNILVIFDASNIQPYIRPYVSSDMQGVNWELLLSAPDEFFASTNGVSFMRSLFGYTLSSLSVIGSVVINLALVLILSFYLLRDDTRISRWLHTHFGMYLPQWDVYANEVDKDLQTIFFGNILHAIITAIIAVTLYVSIDIINPTTIPVPYPTLVGLLCGIASLIPLIGTKLVYLPVGGYMAVWSYSMSGGQTDNLLFPLIFIGASYLVVDQIPDVSIRPYVSTKRIHMGLVMVAYILGPLLFGWYGVFLGPTLLVLSLHFATHIFPHLLEPGVGGFGQESSILTEPVASESSDGDVRPSEQTTVAEDSTETPNHSED